MIETLRYGLEDDGIRMDIAQSTFEAVLANAERFGQILDYPRDENVVEAEPMDGGVRLLLNTKKLGTIRGEHAKQDRLRAMTYVATMASAFTDLNARDPDILQVDMTIDPLGDGTRYGMDAVINRWTAPYYDAQDITTRAMGATALNLGYEVERDIDRSVYARIDTERGVTLETNPVGSCSLDTDGMEYSAEDPNVFLYGHNIYSRQQQLILLSGVIALAKS